MAKVQQDAALARVENAIAELYRGLYRLREARRYREELAAIEALVKMLRENAAHLRGLMAAEPPAPIYDDEE